MVTLSTAFSNNWGAVLLKGIGKGVRNGFADTINEPEEITKVLNGLLMSSRDEILLLFSTSNSFYRAKHSGMLYSLPQVSNGVTFKELTQPSEDITKEPIQEELMLCRSVFNTLPNPYTLIS